MKVPVVCQRRGIKVPVFGRRRGIKVPVVGPRRGIILLSVALARASRSAAASAARLVQVSSLGWCPFASFDMTLHSGVASFDMTLRLGGAVCKPAQARFHESTCQTGSHLRICCPRPCIQRTSAEADAQPAHIGALSPVIPSCTATRPQPAPPTQPAQPP